MTYIQQFINNLTQQERGFYAGVARELLLLQAAPKPDPAAMLLLNQTLAPMLEAMARDGYDVPLETNYTPAQIGRYFGRTK